MRYLFTPDSTTPVIREQVTGAESWPVGTYLFNSITGRHWIRHEAFANQYVEWTPIEPSAFPAELKAIILLLT